MTPLRFEHERTEALEPPEHLKEGQGKQSIVRLVGSGVITGAADDDPPAIGIYASAGARYGVAFLWVTPVLRPMMYIVVMMESTVEQANCPLIEVDADARTLWMNQVARERMRGNEGLVAAAGRLRARDRERDVTLRNALRLAFQAALCKAEKGAADGPSQNLLRCGRLQFGGDELEIAPPPPRAFIVIVGRRIVGVQ